MGRMKVFFCAFCLERDPEGSTSDQTFSQDVSHLATPHNTFTLSQGQRSSLNSTPVGEVIDDNNNNHCVQSMLQINTIQHGISSGTPNRSAEDSPLQQHNELDQPLPSLHSSSSRSILYEPPQESHQQQQSHSNNDAQIPQQQPQNQYQHQNNRDTIEPDNQGTSTKLSYDIISVREPLAKILAERQLLHQQQQQRQILGDHEYIEVYGERGSSCFYEEIAGSTTSSATYDQIGTASNHNYQALINAYATTNRVDEPQQESDPTDHQIQPQNNDRLNDVEENVYDVTHNIDAVDGSSSTNQAFRLNFNPSTSNDLNEQSTSSSQDGKPVMTRSIPVYSVINKASRRNNAIMRTTFDNSRPPQPPPKNLPYTHQPSTSAIQSHQESPINHPEQPQSSIRKPTKDVNNDLRDGNGQHSGLPQPPPRLSKQPMFDAKRRPLPLPDNYETIRNDINGDALARDEDLESVDNGYELLTTNFDDDQVDVGYEKIRDSHLYSGGSLSSQFCPLQMLDNGGYESVQPIYSSPSNALAEPNYEAIGPATASELAAAATARLTAAAAVIDFLNQDQ